MPLLTRALVGSVLFLVLAAAGVAGAQPRCDPPRLLIVVDRSSSMLGRVPGAVSKWEAARTAIAELVTAHHEAIDFGLAPFPDPDRCSPGRVTIEVGRHRPEEILAGLGEPPPEGGSYTPMAATLDVAGEHAPLLDPTRDAHLVLLTDGWEWCSPYDPATRYRPVDAVARLAAAGITVHVVGFGAAVDVLTLNRAAVVAGTARPGCNPETIDPRDPGVCYHRAHDLEELREALSAVGRLVTVESCDGFDNDCDGGVDEAFDGDADHYTTCGTDPDRPGELDRALVDCDDADPAVHPAVEEGCDGIDNDCDGRVDPGCACVDGATAPCGSDIGACLPGVQRCAGGRFGDCAGAIGPLAERCDGVDDDCDGRLDEGMICGAGAACHDGRCMEMGAVPDAATPREAPAPPLAPGCGCGTSGRGPAALPIALAMLAAIAWRRRRM